MYTCLYTPVHTQLTNAHSLFSDTATMGDDSNYLDSDAESVKQISAEYDDDDGLDDYVGDHRTSLQASRARALVESDDDADPGVCENDMLAALNSPTRNCPANGDSERVEGPEVGAASSPRTESHRRAYDAQVGLKVAARCFALYSEIAFTFFVCVFVQIQQMVEEGRGTSHAYMLPEKKKEIIDTFAFNGMVAKERKTPKGHCYNQQFCLSAMPPEMKPA